MPLLAEILLLCALCYLAGIGIGWLTSRRRGRTSYLGDDR